MPFAFAAHFAPQYVEPAMELYRRHFTPSEVLERPYAMVGLPILAADTEAQAKRLLTTPQQRFLSLVRNQPVELRAPVDTMEGLWNSAEADAVAARLALAVVGDREGVKARLQRIVDWLGVDEVFAVTDTYEQSDRLRSYEILADVAKEITVPEQKTN